MVSGAQGWLRPQRDGIGGPPNTGRGAHQVSGIHTIGLGGAPVVGHGAPKFASKVPKCWCWDRKTGFGGPRIGLEGTKRWPKGHKSWFRGPLGLASGPKEMASVPSNCWYGKPHNWSGGGGQVLVSGPRRRFRGHPRLASKELIRDSQVLVLGLPRVGFGAMFDLRSPKR